ncbi:MAG: two-component sensor histidine kinase [Proteobacteria bacterium]|jgi:signal transduction histidine kinase|nr:two-component sensor histidine kinase [Pseudomonadota bacterium]
MSSIRARVLLAVLGILAVAALLVGIVTYRSVRAETEALFDYQLRQMALSLRDQGEVAPAQASALVDEQLDFVVQVWTGDGRGLYASRAHVALPQRAQLGYADVQVAGQVWRSFSVAMPSRVIQVSQPLAIRRKLAADAAYAAVLPLLLVAPFMAAAAWWLTTLALRPLQRVAAGVRQRDEQSLEPLPAAGLPDEVAPLVAALNALLQRLGQSLDTQRAFVADAAHELRSPLTALKLQLQLFERAGGETDRAAATKALAAGIERAARLVEQLLTLARTEPGAAGSSLQRLDLSELVREAVADTVPLAVARGTRFELRADAPVPVDGDRAALAALVRNLADNAVRYSPPGARVELRVSMADGAPTLQVDDAGPGIPPAERERVFDRFYRRGLADEPGTGLGLAIVRGVAQRHGATVALEDSPLGGLRVTVRFGAAVPT